ncbi:MAG: O-antigen ligase family protein [Pseudomonadota bacterium]
MGRKYREVTDEEFYSLRIAPVWRHFRKESFAFWMICAYLFFEYVRPQSIYPVINFLPWTQLVVLGAFAGCMMDKTVRWVSSPINVLLIVFFIVILLSSYLAYFPGISLENLDKYYLWVVIYFLIINIVNTRRRFFVFICIFLVASFKISLSLAMVWTKRGFSFTDWGLKGPPGFFENSGELAIQMLVFWPIAWAFCQTLKPRISRAWYLVLLLMPITAIMVILGASSRGAQLALICQLAIMNYRTILKPKVFVSMSVAFVLIWVFLPDEQKERFSSIGQDVTSQQRMLYWENGVEMIQDNPALGVGFYNFSPYYEKYYPEDILLRRAELPHNIFIQVGTDTGVIGLVVFAGFLIFALRKARNFRMQGCPEADPKLPGRCANLSLIGFIVAGQFVTVAYYPFLWIHLALLVSMTNSFRLEKSRNKGTL